MTLESGRKLLGFGTAVGASALIGTRQGMAPWPIGSMGMSDEGPSDREQRIKDRAYVIWIEAGCPDGQADEHWRKASEAIDEEEAAVTPLTDLTAEPVPLVPPNR